MKEISVEEAKKIWDNKTHEFIDVRENEEYEEFHIPNIKLIPLGEVEDRAKELSKDKKYIMVCRSGGRSGRAISILEPMGFDVTNMAGGSLAWKANNYPLD